MTSAPGPAANSGPLVSAIVPVYNGERFIASALDSILAQSYRPLEVIVVDDGSEDDTASVARSYPSIRYIHQANQGPSTARNTGIAEAKGDIIAFLDADDLWTTDKLSVQVAYLESHPEVGYVIGRVRHVMQPGMSKPAWISKELLTTESLAYLPSSLAVRRAVIEEVGGFDSAIAYGEGVDWFSRAKDRGVSASILPRVLHYRMIHEDNASHDNRRKERGFLQAARLSVARKRRNRSPKRYRSAIE